MPPPPLNETVARMHAAAQVAARAAPRPPAVEVRYVGRREGYAVRAHSVVAGRVEDVMAMHTASTSPFRDVQYTSWKRDGNTIVAEFRMLGRAVRYTCTVDDASARFTGDTIEGAWTATAVGPDATWVGLTQTVRIGIPCLGGIIEARVRRAFEDIAAQCITRCLPRAPPR